MSRIYRYFPKPPNSAAWCSSQVKAPILQGILSHIPIKAEGLEEQLKKAGSSMEKVLKVNVYLNDIADYQGMKKYLKDGLEKSTG